MPLRNFFGAFMLKGAIMIQTIGTIFEILGPLIILVTMFIGLHIISKTPDDLYYSNPKKFKKSLYKGFAIGCSGVALTIIGMLIRFFAG
jgi:hypothetical protein